MTTLRATAYTLTSLASVVFLALAAYGAVQFARLQDSFGPLHPTLRSGTVLDGVAGTDPAGPLVDAESAAPSAPAAGDRP